jgi:hypothetical protein
MGEIDLRLRQLGPTHGTIDPRFEGRTARLAEDQPSALAHEFPRRHDEWS